MTDLLHNAEALTEVPPAGPTADEIEGLNVESASPFRMAMRRFVHHRMAMICLVVFLIIAVFIILAPWTARYPQSHSLPPIDGQSSFVSPRSQAWFGTDELNRDLYSPRHLGRSGVAVHRPRRGAHRQHRRHDRRRHRRLPRWVDRRHPDARDRPVPRLPAARRRCSCCATCSPRCTRSNWLFGELSSIRFIIVLLALVTWMGVARIVRGVVLSLKEREFIEAARAIGSKRPADRRRAT